MAITAEQFGFRSQRSSIVALMMNLTPAQDWLTIKQGSNKNNIRTRPAHLANDIDGAFNWLLHDHLINLLEHIRSPNHLVRTIASFNTHKTISLTFDMEQEDPFPFPSRVPQGSFLSPILFVNYAAALSTPGPQPLLHHAKSYVDDEVMIPGATSQKAASCALQLQLDHRIAGAPFLNI